MISVFHPNGQLRGHVYLPSSKSLTNRFYILNHLFPQIEIENPSISEDGELMHRALKSSAYEINVNHSGTALRFLTAYFAFENGRRVILSGSERLKQRPIEPLVNSLLKVGCRISYAEKVGFAPLIIEGISPPKGPVIFEIDTALSSQFLSAILLQSVRFTQGLVIKFKGLVNSKSYVYQTLQVLELIGVHTYISGNEILIQPPKKIKPSNFIIESDWSAASFLFGLSTLTNYCNLLLLDLFRHSHQGDEMQLPLFERLGLAYSFQKNGMKLKSPTPNQQSLKANLSNMPDVTPALAVNAAIKNVDCLFTGLDTLPLKESNRLEALKIELEKFGKKVEINNNSLKISGTFQVNPDAVIETYNDHRIAMAFAQLAMVQKVNINNPDVVVKSFPAFWSQLKILGFVIEHTQ